MSNWDPWFTWRFIRWGIFSALFGLVAGPFIIQTDGPAFGSAVIIAALTGYLWPCFWPQHFRSIRRLRIAVFCLIWIGLLGLSVLLTPLLQSQSSHLYCVQAFSFAFTLLSSVYCDRDDDDGQKRAYAGLSKAIGALVARVAAIHGKPATKSCYTK